MLEEMAAGGSTVSDDFMLQEDVKLMVEIGLDVYRLSISWSRLIPNGEGPINPKGLQFYNNSRGDSTIEPYLAVHHIFLSHFSVVRLYRRKYKMKTGQPLKEPVIFLLVGNAVASFTNFIDARNVSITSGPTEYISSPDGSPTLDSFYSKFHNLKRVLEDDSSSDNSSLISSNSDIGSCNIDVT
ncbi:hypothetical protein HN51_032044 [Arachis hypogaea]